MATVDKNGKELRVGDVVEFVDTTCIGNAWPEIGKIYTIAGIEDSSARYQTLIRFKETHKQCFSFRVKKVEKPKEQEPNTANEFKPDGGPSKYYDFPFKDWTTVNDMVEYLAKEKWGHLSWIFKDILKAVTRWGDKKGTEKAYDARKIIYYGCRLLMSVTDKQEVQKYLKELQNDAQFN